MDAAVLRVLEALLDVAVCSQCLEVVTGLDTIAVEGALARLAEPLTVAALVGVCHRCHGLSSVYQLNPRLLVTPVSERMNGAAAPRPKGPAKRPGSRAKR